MSVANGPVESGISDEDALAMAEAVVLHLLGSTVRQVARIGGGLTNFVFTVDHARARSSCA